jgi:hypothetical protein
MAKGKKHGVGSGYNMLGPGDVFGEIAFFTEVPQLEVSGGCKTCAGGAEGMLTACRWLAKDLHSTACAVLLEDRALCFESASYESVSYDRLFHVGAAAGGQHVIDGVLAAWWWVALGCIQRDSALLHGRGRCAWDRLLGNMGHRHLAACTMS